MPVRARNVCGPMPLQFAGSFGNYGLQQHLIVIFEQSPPGSDSLHVILLLYSSAACNRTTHRLNWPMPIVLGYITRDLCLFLSTVKSQVLPRQYYLSTHMCWRQWQIYDVHIRHCGSRNQTFRHELRLLNYTIDRLTSLFERSHAQSRTKFMLSIADILRRREGTIWLTSLMLWPHASVVRAHAGRLMPGLFDCWNCHGPMIGCLRLSHRYAGCECPLQAHQWTRWVRCKFTGIKDSWTLSNS